jgi:hypothetical protein
MGRVRRTLYYYIKEQCAPANISPYLDGEKGPKKESKEKKKISVYKRVNKPKQCCLQTFCFPCFHSGRPWLAFQTCPRDGYHEAYFSGHIFDASCVCVVSLFEGQAKGMEGKAFV